MKQDLTGERSSISSALLSDNLLEIPWHRAAARDSRWHWQVGYEPLAVPQLIEEILIKFLIQRQRFPIRLSRHFLSLCTLPYLQPFEDVNKRVSGWRQTFPSLPTTCVPYPLWTCRKIFIHTDYLGFMN